MYIIPKKSQYTGDHTLIVKNELISYKYTCLGQRGRVIWAEVSPDKGTKHFRDLMLADLTFLADRFGRLGVSG